MLSNKYPEDLTRGMEAFSLAADAFSSVFRNHYGPPSGDSLVIDSKFVLLMRRTNILFRESKHDRGPELFIGPFTEQVKINIAALDSRCVGMKPIPAKDPRRFQYLLKEYLDAIAHFTTHVPTTLTLEKAWNNLSAAWSQFEWLALTEGFTKKKMLTNMRNKLDKINKYLPPDTPGKANKMVRKDVLLDKYYLFITLLNDSFEGLTYSQAVRVLGYFLVAYKIENGEPEKVANKVKRYLQRNRARLDEIISLRENPPTISPTGNQ